MLTAEEARKLVGPTVEEKVQDLLKAVEEAAKNKKRELKTGWDYSQDRDLWIDGGYSKTKDWERAVKILRGLGYDVSFYYDEYQFVDMYTSIKW